MRERAWATIGMWAAMAIAVDRILASLKYTEMVVNPINSNELIGQITLVSESWQLGAAILIFVIVLAAMGGTIAIWQNASQPAEQTLKQAEKAKRDNREARVKRLLATLDDDELAALEQGDAEERLSLEALLRRK